MNKVPDKNDIISNKYDRNLFIDVQKIPSLHNNVSLLANEELEVHSVSAWKEVKLRASGQPDGPTQPTRRPLIQAGPHESLKDVAVRILRNQISVVPIIHSPTHDGSCPHPLGDMGSRNGCRNYSNLTIWALVGVSNHNLTLIVMDLDLFYILSFKICSQVSSIPIVDGNGSLLDVYSRSDITALAKDGAYAHIQPDQMKSIAVKKLSDESMKALQLTYKANIISNCQRRFQTCLRTNTLYEIMELLSDPGAF
ncbi:hypothetical protein ACLOJK_023762 [Asimina triloba]